MAVPPAWRTIHRRAFDVREAQWRNIVAGEDTKKHANTIASLRLGTYVVDKLVVTDRLSPFRPVIANKGVQ